VKNLSVLLIDGQSTYALNVIRCLATAGHQVHVLSTADRASLRVAQPVSSFRLWDGIDGPGALAACEEIARQLQADLCLAIDEQAIAVLAESPDRPSVPIAPIPTVASLRTAVDKWQFAEFSRTWQLPHPPTYLCTPDAEFQRRLAAVRFPVLIKPRRGGNAAGIRQFRDREALLRHLDNNPQLFGTTIIQTLIPGEDIDCSVLCRDGKILAYTIQRPFLPSEGFKPPGAVELVHDDDVLRVVRDALMTLNWTGVAHIDLRREAETNDLRILEINPRFWGSVLASLHAGVNFPHLACLAALDEPFAVPSFRECRYVAGSTAARLWRHGQIGLRRAGFSFRDTALAYALADPVAWFLDFFK
jgi:predicted ATP-grasp superfamily ATP-dependent carboligase